MQTIHVGVDPETRKSAALNPALPPLVQWLVVLAAWGRVNALDNREKRSRTLHAAVRALVARNDGDRRQDVDIAAVLALYRRGELPIGSADPAA